MAARDPGRPGHHGHHGPRVVSPALVGRDRELAKLVPTVTHPPSVVIVEGEAGIGKTRLVAELRTRPELAGHRFAVGSCRPVREPFPLGPVLEAARGLAAAVTPETLSPVAGALRPLLPELAEVLPPRPEPLGDRMAERHRVFRGLVELVRATGPLALVLEDLHWADDHTVDFLRYLLGDPPDELTLVVTYRSEEVDPAVRALPATRTRAHLVLPPLDVPQTGALAAAIVDADRVSGDFASYLCERTGGLPFAVEEVMALLRERGVVDRHGHHWTRATLDELAVPTGIRDHVLERAGRLPAAHRGLLQAVAVLPHPAPEHLVAAVSGDLPAEVAGGLSQAIALGLLVDGPHGVGFRHALAAQAVYHDIPGPRRRQLHRRAAAALRERTPEQLGQIAHHLRHADRRSEWAAVAEQAAEAAATLGNYDEAGRLLAEVLRHGAPEPATAGTLAVKLGWAATQMRDAVTVCPLLAEVLDQDLPRPVRGELRYLLAVLLDRSRLETGRVGRLLHLAAEDLDSRPELRAQAMATQATRGTPPHSFARRKRLLDRALAALPAGHPPYDVFLLGKVAATLLEMGDPRWRELADRIEALTGGEPRHPDHARAYGWVGDAAVHVGDHETAAKLLGALRTGAGARGGHRVVAQLRASLAALHYCCGTWDGLAEEVAALPAELVDLHRSQAQVGAVAGALALAHGDLDGAQRRLTPVADRAEGSSLSLAVAVVALVRLALARQEQAAAAATADRYLAGHDPRTLWPVTFRALPWLAEAYAAAGRVTEARSLVYRYARGLAGIRAPLAPAALRHAQGFVAAAGGQPAAAARYFLAAAQRYRSGRSRYEAAQAAERAARALLAAGDPAGASGSLRAALAGYRRLGAGWDLSRAARTARRYGVSVPARHRGGHRGYGAELSPREREVAALAATGRTNKEIGAELFLSAETVKKHLQAAMRKLGAQSRTRLAHQLRH